MGPATGTRLRDSGRRRAALRAGDLSPTPVQQIVHRLDRRAGARRGARALVDVLLRAGAGAPVARAIPLRPRSRVAGRPLGTLPSLRRGGRRDPISSRPYRPGDDLRSIDQAASARLSSARGTAELVVREHLAEEAPFVLLAVDEGPTMELHPQGSPWLCKPAAVEAATSLILASAARTRSPVRRTSLWPLEDLLKLRELRPGTFLFAISDFLQPMPPTALAEAVERRLDLVPILVQDPTWERTFPDVAGVPLRVRDPVSGRCSTVRLSRHEVEQQRTANESRFAALLAEFARVGLEPVVLDREQPREVYGHFLAWAEGRRRAHWAA
ncbi:MAG: hypothetical protein C5B48_02875 [Candidatus Rokuibacteriota bacterium]|nr:MAG: hypothetical protein C5B48_02875 [Candidatus Rokubacteria bacterium]